MNDARLVPSRLLTAETTQELRRKLDCFYADGSGYLAFQEPSDQPHCWQHLKSQIEHLLAAGKDRVHVLEIGAGRTGFASYLEKEGLRSSVVFHAQDVTRFNEAWLNTHADATFFGDAADCGHRGEMDIVFSTYVFEHVTDPAQHLDVLWSLVSATPGAEGSLFLFSPRYDLPGYLCPSARHLPAWVRLRFLLAASLWRLASLITRQPQFLIQTDLAAFHRPFYLDSDAVHWVSLIDLKLWASTHFGRCESLRVGSLEVFSKNWIIKRFCTAAVKITKLGAARAPGG